MLAPSCVFFIRGVGWSGENLTHNKVCNFLLGREMIEMVIFFHLTVLFIHK